MKKILQNKISDMIIETQIYDHNYSRKLFSNAWFCGMIYMLHSRENNIVHELLLTNILYNDYFFHFLRDIVEK